jgi:hypothetical protein
MRAIVIERSGWTAFPRRRRAPARPDDVLIEAARDENCRPRGCLERATTSAR